MSVADKLNVVHKGGDLVQPSIYNTMIWKQVKADINDLMTAEI